MRDVLARLATPRGVVAVGALALAVLAALGVRLPDELSAALGQVLLALLS